VPILALSRSLVEEIEYEHAGDDAKNTAIAAALGYCRLSKLLQFPTKDCALTLPVSSICHCAVRILAGLANVGRNG